MELIIRANTKRVTKLANQESNGWTVDFCKRMKNLVVKTRVPNRRGEATSPASVTHCGVAG